MTSTSSRARVHRVPLTAVRDPAHFGASIVHEVGGEAGGDAPAPWLRSFLTGRRRLLFLDNVEQFGEQVTLLGELLAACPDLTILATSRTQLALSAETAVRVRPLGVPSRAARSTAATVEQATAVQLFVARARAVDLDFALDDATAPAVATLCRRLDGMPLALELAAAQLRVLPPAAILSRLEQRLPFPVAPPRPGIAASMRSSPPATTSSLRRSSASSAAWPSSPAGSTRPPPPRPWVVR
ncbi:MAG: hypothetical protein ACRDJW_15095, partial [Thermomicrobiales bacterium]